MKYLKAYLIDLSASSIDIKIPGLLLFDCFFRKVVKAKSISNASKSSEKILSCLSKTE